MMTLAEQARQYESLRADGATPSEAILALSVIADVDRTIELVGPKGYVHGWRYLGPGEPMAKGSPSIAYAQRAKLARISGEKSRVERSHEEIKQHAAELAAKAAAEAKAASQRYIEEKERETAKAEKKRRLKTLAAHAGLIVAGGILAAIEGQLGVPGAAQIASALAPQLLQEAVDNKFGLG